MEQEEFLSVQDVARILHVSSKSVRRRFGNLPGVIDIGERRPAYGRPYQILRIPRGVLRRFTELHDVGRKLI